MENGNEAAGFKQIELQSLCSEEVLPKGCRKPRFRTVVKRVPASLREPSEAEFPVAFIVHEGADVEEVRIFAGELYRVDARPLADSYSETPHRCWREFVWEVGPLDGAPESQAISKLLPDYPTYKSAREVDKAIEAFCSSHVAFGGKLWRQTPEPCYRVLWAGSFAVAWYFDGECESSVNRDLALARAEARIADSATPGEREWARKTHGEVRIDALIPNASALPSHSECLEWKATSSFNARVEARAEAFERDSLETPAWLKDAISGAKEARERLVWDLATRFRRRISGEGAQVAPEDVERARGMFLLLDD